MSTLQRMILLKLTLLSTIILSGCNANHYSIYRTEQLKPDQANVIAVDAKQRFLLSNVITKTTQEIPATPAIEGKAATQATPATESKPAVPGTPASTEQIRRFCLEPSPDVFSVLSQAASGGGSFGQTADPKSMNIALQAAFSSSEAGASISRTQTVNMLKEMMYRTCERYLNGQISDDQYPIIAARDQRIMTSILAIEQLTGAILPKPVVIATTGSAATGQSTSDAILALDKASKQVTEKRGALKTAQNALDGIDNPADTCKTLKEKKADLTADEQTKLDQCNDKQNKFEVAKQELKDAQDFYDHLANLAGKPGISSASSNAKLLTPTLAATETDLNIEKDRTQRITAVANVVNEIVSHSFNQDDETSFYCYGAIKNEKETNVKTACLDFITTKVRANTAEVARAANLKLETEDTIRDINELKKIKFEQFWKKIKTTSDQVDNNKLKKIIDNGFPNISSQYLQSSLDAMKKNRTKDAILKIFNSLQLWEINSLLKD